MCACKASRFGQHLASTSDSATNGDDRRKMRQVQGFLVLRLLRGGPVCRSASTEYPAQDSSTTGRRQMPEYPQRQAPTSMSESAYSLHGPLPWRLSPPHQKNPCQNPCAFVPAFDLGQFTITSQKNKSSPMISTTCRKSKSPARFSHVLISPGRQAHREPSRTKNSLASERRITVELDSLRCLQQAPPGEPETGFITPPSGEP